MLDAKAGIGQRLPDQQWQAANMVARGQLRHYATIGAMQVDLTEQRIGQKPAFTVVKCDTGFVAGGFKSQY